MQAELQEAQDSVKVMKQEAARKQAALAAAQAQLTDLRASEHGPAALQAGITILWSLQSPKKHFKAEHNLHVPSMCRLKAVGNRYQGCSLIKQLGLPSSKSHAAREPEAMRQGKLPCSCHKHRSSHGHAGGAGGSRRC